MLNDINARAISIANNNQPVKVGQDFKDYQYFFNNYTNYTSASNARGTQRTTSESNNRYIQKNRSGMDMNDANF